MEVTTASTDKNAIPTLDKWVNDYQPPMTANTNKTMNFDRTFDRLSSSSPTRAVDCIKITSAHNKFSFPKEARMGP